MKRLFNSCARRREGLSLLAAGALPESERAEIERHLAACADCREYYRQMQNLVRPFARWENGLDVITPSESAKSRWKGAIEAAGRSHSPARFEPGTAFVQWWRETIWPYRRAWAAMATVWLAMWVMNARMFDTPKVALSAKVNSGAALVQTIANEKQILAELAPSPGEQPAEPPHRDAPPPRSERALPWKAC